MDAIRTAWQGREPKYCFINEEKLEALARSLAWRKFEIPAWDAPVFPEANDETLIDFLGVANAVNYCFTEPISGVKFTAEYPRGSGTTWRGAFGMFACLKRALDEGVPILERDFLADPKAWFLNRDGKELKYNQEWYRSNGEVVMRPATAGELRMSIGRAMSIFAGTNIHIPMLKERVESLHDLAFAMEQLKLVRGFSDLFERCDYYAFGTKERPLSGIVDQLVRFAAYHDTQVDPLTQKKLSFHKRAQLLVLMYHGRALSSNGALQPIRDADKIGPIADYQVPNALRYFGVLEYNPEAAEALNCGFIFEKDHPVVIETRAQMCLAVEQLLEKINERRLRWKKKPITMVELDYALWLGGKQSPYKHIRVLTTAF